MAGNRADFVPRPARRPARAAVEGVKAAVEAGQSAAEHCAPAAAWFVRSRAWAWWLHIRLWALQFDTGKRLFSIVITARGLLKNTATHPDRLFPGVDLLDTATCTWTPAATDDDLAGTSYVKNMFFAYYLLVALPVVLLDVAAVYGSVRLRKWCDPRARSPLCRSPHYLLP